MHVQIKRAIASEAEAVAEIGRQTFYETWKAVNTEEDLQLYMNQAFDPGKIKKELDQPDITTYLFIYANGKMAGYAKLRNDRTHPLLTGKCIELERIYVLKEFQGIKAGKALMDECMGIASGDGYVCIWLGVNQENFKAINFYKRYGFEVFGTKQFKLGNAVDEDFLMKKLL